MKTAITILLFALSAYTQWLPLGSILSSQSVTCPNNSGSIKGTCYQVTMNACPNVAAVPTVTIKVVLSQGTSKGTVILGTAYGSAGFYEKAYTYGATVISGLQSAGFISVQLSFSQGYGWMNNGSADGPLSDSCQWGTVNKWVYQNIHQGGSSAPFCATGVSGSASAIAYMLNNYGFGDANSGAGVFYSMVELTSGPPLGRLDLGCTPNEPTTTNNVCHIKARQSFWPSQNSLINSAYGNTNCGNGSEQAQWFADSNANPAWIFDFPSTDVHALFGGQDNGVAPPFGQYWINLVQSKCETGCVQDANHLMPDWLDAAQRILSDLTTYCHLQ